MAPSSSSLEPQAPSPPPLRPAQFGLTSLLLAMAAISALLAVMNSVGGVWSLIILLSLALVGAHVAGNALGTTLRDQASPEAPRHIDAPAMGAAAAARQLAASGQLLTHRRPGAVTRAAAAASALLGGGLGVLAALHLELPLPGLVLISASLAVVGAWFGFLGSCFLVVARQAMHEALAVPTSDAAVRTSSRRV